MAIRESVQFFATQKRYGLLKTEPVFALARAWQWQQELESGEYSTVEELATAKKIDVSYLRRMLRLNSLAPDIVEAILQNNAPDHISLRTLYRGIAPSWAEQRRQLLEI